MSLGSYGNWLQMKTAASAQALSTSSQSSVGSVKSTQGQGANAAWTTYFAVMRDFNLFLFSHEYVPTTLDDVVDEEYLALSVAHIESVKQCTGNAAELYLEI